VSVSIGTTITVLSNSIANTALPTIANSFHVTSAESIWVVNGLQLTTTSTLLVLCLGRRCARSEAGVLERAAPLHISHARLRARADVRGARAHARPARPRRRSTSGDDQLAQSALSFHTHSWGGPSRSTRSSSPSGPPAVRRSAHHSSFAPWPWIFALNVPLGALAARARLALSARDQSDRSEARLSLGGAGSRAFGSIIYALDGIARRMPAPETALIAATGLLAMGFFIRRQLRLEHPMLAVDLSGFRSSAFPCSHPRQRIPLKG